MFIQQENDPFGSYNEVNELVYPEVIRVKGDDHWYGDQNSIEAIKSQLNQ